VRDSLRDTATGPAEHQARAAPANGRDRLSGRVDLADRRRARRRRRAGPPRLVALPAERHPPLEGEDCVFLTDFWVQGLLRVVGARKTGEKAAAAALRTMLAHGWIEDTDTTKKARRPGRGERGVGAHSYWWRVFRVPALSRAVAYFFPQGAYARLPAAPPPVGSLSAFLRCQGLIPRRRRRSRPNPGSVQWVFLHSGPP
jgi:hypothetical protein